MTSNETSANNPVRVSELARMLEKRLPVLPTPGGNLNKMPPSCSANSMSEPDVNMNDQTNHLDDQGSVETMIAEGSGNTTAKNTDSDTETNLVEEMRKRLAALREHNQETQPCSAAEQQTSISKDIWTENLKSQTSDAAINRTMTKPQIPPKPANLRSSFRNTSPISNPNPSGAPSCVSPVPPAPPKKPSTLQLETSALHPAGDSVSSFQSTSSFDPMTSRSDSRTSVSSSSTSLTSGALDTQQTFCDDDMTPVVERTIVVAPMVEEITADDRQTISRILSKVRQRYENGGDTTDSITQGPSTETLSTMIPQDVGRIRDKSTRQGNKQLPKTNSAPNNTDLNVDQTQRPGSADSVIRKSGGQYLSPDSGFIENGNHQAGSSSSSDMRSSTLSTVDDRNSMMSQSNTMDDLQNESKRKYRLTASAQELMKTEETYVKQLRILGEEFPSAILEANTQLNRSVYTGDAVKQLQNAIGQILPVHEKLLNAIKTSIDNWDPDHPVLAATVHSMAPFLRCCKFFVQKRQVYGEQLRTGRKEQRLFGEVCRQFEAHHFNNLSIDYQLDIVHQRVMRYPMLMENYRKFLHLDSEEYRKCSETIHLTQEIANEIDQSVADGTMQHVFDAQRRLQNAFEAVAPGRKLLREGAIQKQSRKNVDWRHLFLFSDYLLYCRTAVVGSDLLKITCKLVLDKDRVVANRDEHHEYRTHFSVESVHRSMKFIAKDSIERNQWVDMINKAVRDRRMILKQQRGSISHGHEAPCSPTTSNNNQSTSEELLIGDRAPVWEPDREVTMCMLCSAPFTMILRRKHHCRLCGKIICDRCYIHAPIKFENWVSNITCVRCEPVYAKRVASLPASAFANFPWQRDKPIPVENHGLNVVKHYFKKRKKAAGTLKFGSQSASSLKTAMDDILMISPTDLPSATGWDQSPTSGGGDLVDTAGTTPSEVPSETSGSAPSSRVSRSQSCTSQTSGVDGNQLESGKLKKFTGTASKETWTEYWAVLTPATLDLYKARKDNLPAHRIPLFGFNYVELEDRDSGLEFELRHANQMGNSAALVHRFRADDVGHTRTSDKWADSIQEILQQFAAAFEAAQ